MRRGPSILTILVWAIIAVVLINMVFSIFGSGMSGGIPASTTQRERVDTRNAYINDCVRDEIGWIDNASRLSRDLQYFYKETGCQPYIILRRYDSSMRSDSDREAWTRDFYDTEFAENQNVLLYVYFCDERDEGYGDSTLWMGTESSVVMDDEAVDIFWAYLDYDWDSWDVNDNDGMFADVFRRTADRIMTTTTTGKDITKTLIIGCSAIGILVVALFILKAVHKRKREEAQETIDILNAPLGETTADRAVSDMADRYNGNQN